METHKLTLKEILDNDFKVALQMTVNRNLYGKGAGTVAKIFEKVNEYLKSYFDYQNKIIEKHEGEKDKSEFEKELEDLQSLEFEVKFQKVKKPLELSAIEASKLKFLFEDEKDDTEISNPFEKLEKASIESESE